MANDTATCELQGDNHGQQHRKPSFLILTRQLGERFHIGDDIRVTVTRVVGNQVAFGFEAPRSVQIDREEKSSLKRRFAPQAQTAGDGTITYRLSYCSRDDSYICGGKNYPTRVAVRSAALACAAERMERGLHAFDSYTAFRESDGRQVAVAVYALADDSVLMQKGRGYSRMGSDDR